MATGQGSSSKPNYRIRAVERALDVLEAFTIREPALDLDALCHRTGLPKSTVFKILSVLEQRGYVQKHAAEGTYRIGLQAFQVGNQYLAGLTMIEIVHPYLKKLASRFPQSAVHLAVLSPTGNKVVYVDMVTLNTFVVLGPVGGQAPAHATALGKCLLAGLEEEALERRLADIALPRLTPRTITDFQELREHLQVVRAQGYALDDEETSPGNLCVGIPVRDRQGCTVAAISTAHMKGAMGDDLPTIVSVMRQTSEEVSRLMGYVPPPEGA